MALPMLVGGTECGPSNPLQNLSKRFEQDRGAQQDFFGAGRAGSSREAFRSQQAGPSTADQDAARFFSATSGAGPISSPDAHFDLAALHQALPAAPHHHAHAQPMQQSQANASAGWAADFMMSAASPMEALHAPSLMQSASQSSASQHQLQQYNAAVHTAQMGWNPGMGASSSAFRMNTMNQMPGVMPQMQMQPQAQGMVSTSKRISWDKEFRALDLNLSSSTAQPLAQDLHQQEQAQTSTQKPFEGDDLAKTAGMLLDHVKHEQNPKFQNSQFLSLMRQLRDGEVIVEGNQMVESDGTRTSTTANGGGVDVKGKGRAYAPVASTSQLGVQQQPLLQQQQEGEGMQEDANDAYFREENEEYARYWDRSDRARFDMPKGTSMESVGWDRLQQDWDAFEATATGIKQVNNYQFQENNPYLLGESSRTRQHDMHSGARQSVFESVLELEAAVQRDPSNAGLWYELGVRQQENEREQKALAALQRAVSLDPTHLPAWLALGISYTNDGNRQGTYDAVAEWVARNDRYAGAVNAFKEGNKEREGMSSHERFARLIECLIVMARSDVGAGEVDADIQIALAVLLNTNEEYEKAQDCFKTALAVRPEDWLLYNRVGATMANSGRAEEALQYYYRALELNPTYIRARFNLGISCINLRRYEEAAQHVLDALFLQDSESTMEGNNDKKGVISNALWDSLKTTCLHMQRADLATLCDLRDVDGFRKRFYG